MYLLSPELFNRSFDLGLSILVSVASLQTGLGDGCLYPGGIVAATSIFVRNSCTRSLAAFSVRERAHNESTMSTMDRSDG